MIREGKWDLAELLVVLGGVLGILFAFLRVMGIWQPWATLIVADWTVTWIEIAMFAIILLIGFLKTDIENYYGFIILLVCGLLATILLANIAGILWIVSAVIIIIHGD